MRRYVENIVTVQAIDRDLLRVADVHGDGAHIPGERGARAIGRDVEYFSRGRAVEDQFIGARAALDEVAAVAGVPNEFVRTSASEHLVDARTARDRVVAVAAIDVIGSG